MRKRELPALLLLLAGSGGSLTTLALSAFDALTGVTSLAETFALLTLGFGLGAVAGLPLALWGRFRPRKQPVSRSRRLWTRAAAVATGCLGCLGGLALLYVLSERRHEQLLKEYHELLEEGKRFQEEMKREWDHLERAEREYQNRRFGTARTQPSPRIPKDAAPSGPRP